MPKEHVLIVVKTYPVFSRKYVELVCTGGFREDGSWIRIYPSPFRFLSDSQRYKKYQWVKLDLRKNPSDLRPESYTPTNIDDIELGEVIGTENQWAERRRLVLDSSAVHANLEEIITAAHNNQYSLAIFKPTKILGFCFEKIEDNQVFDKEKIAEELSRQGSFFEESADFKLMPPLPYKFRFKFEDDNGKISNLMIEDWETGQLYWNCLKHNQGNEEKALAQVRKKYWDDFVCTKDLYFFLGTTYQWHIRKAPNPYVIVGTFHPPKIKQFDLL